MKRQILDQRKQDKVIYTLTQLNEYSKIDKRLLYYTLMLKKMLKRVFKCSKIMLKENDED